MPRSALGKPTPDQRFARIGSWVGGLGLAWLVTQRLLPLDGLPWFLIAWFVLGTLVTAVTAAMTGGAVEVKDQVAESVITGASLVGRRRRRLGRRLRRLARAGGRSRTSTSSPRT